MFDGATLFLSQFVSASPPPRSDIILARVLCKDFNPTIVCSLLIIAMVGNGGDYVDMFCIPLPPIQGRW